MQCYEQHERFQHLQATSINGRLQLAALYAALGTLVPEPWPQRMTGGQVALQLLRQCWSDRPLAPADLAQLRNVGALGGHITPALGVLAHELEVGGVRWGGLWNQAVLALATCCKRSA